MTLLPLAIMGGLNLAQEYNKSRETNKIRNLQQQAEEQNYRDYVANYQATAEYNKQLAQYEANARAANAAARSATDANRRAAAEKALKVKNDYSQQLMALYEPFKQMSTQLLPQMAGAYGQGLGQLNMLQAYANRPDMMARMSGSVPAAQTQLQLPSYLAGGVRR